MDSLAWLTAFCPVLASIVSITYAALQRRVSSSRGRFSSTLPQVRFVLQASGGIGNQDVDITALAA